MKHPGNVCLFHEEREKAVLDAYVRLRKSLRCKDIYRAVGESPSPRFWISEERAATIYGRVKSGWTMAGVLPRRQVMYRELCGRMEAVLEKDEALTYSEAAFVVVRQPAPSFYLSPSSVGAILSNALKRRSHERRRRYTC